MNVLKANFPLKSDINDVAVDNFATLCRTCLSSDSLIPIENFVSENNEPLSELLWQHFEYELDYINNLPQNICTNCANEIYKFHLFKKQIVNNHKLFKDALNKANKTEEIFIKSEVEDTGNQMAENLQTDEVDIESETVHEKVDKLKLSKKIEYVCGSCPIAFAKISDLREHMQEMKHFKKIKKKVKCPCCKKMLAYGTLSVHLNANNKEQPFRCKGLTQLFHKTSEENADDYTCKICGGNFRKISDYKQHIKKHKLKSKKNIEVKEEVCGECNKTFKTKLLLKAHSLKHGFLCKDCGKRFHTESTFQCHLELHEQEKIFICSICKKTSTYDSNDKPINCNVCEEKHTQLGDVKQYQKNHKSAPLTYYEKNVSFKGNVKLQMRTHTGETPHLCTYCGRGFYNVNRWKKHELSHVETVKSKK